jgi:hypothetical protein
LVPSKVTDRGSEPTTQVVIPMQIPPTHSASFAPQLVPSVALVHADELEAGVQTSQPLVLVAPEAYAVPLIRQPGSQLPPMQTSSAGQLAAPSTLVQEEVLEVGEQISQPLFVVAFGE